MAASKVNIKFVVILCLVLGVLAAGLIGVAAFVHLKSGERNITRGEEFEKQGNFAKAAEAYSKAVAKEPTRVDWINKWRDALLKKVPENSTIFQNDYVAYTRMILPALHRAEPTNVQAHAGALQALLDESMSFGGTRRSWENLVNVTQTSLDTFEVSGADPKGDWNRLKRFRGIATVNIAAEEPTYDPKKLDRARTDLEAALAIDPTDVESVASLASWHVISADRALTAAKLDEERSHLTQAIELFDNLAKAKPNDPVVLLEQFRLSAAMASRRIQQDRSRAEYFQQLRAAYAALEPQAARVHSALMTADPKTINARLVMQYMSLAAIANPTQGNKLVDDVLTHALSGQPNDAWLLFIRARQTGNAGKHEEAIEQYQKIVDLPNMTVGLEGMRLNDLKTISQIQQASSALVLAGTAEKDPAVYKRQMDRAKAYRQKLAQDALSEKAPQLLLLDAKIKIAENEYSAAQQLLAEHSRLTNDIGPDAAESLLLQANLAVQARQLGRAKEAYQKALRLQPGLIMAREMLAGILQQLNETDEAIKEYESVLSTNPENENAQRQLRILKAVGGDRAAIKDPIELAIVDAETILRKGGPDRKGDMQGAIKFLEDAVPKNNYDGRLVYSLFELYRATDQRDAAKKLLTTASEKHPNDPSFKARLQNMESVATLDQALATIDGSSMPALDKVYNRIQAFKSFQRPEQATQEIQKAMDAGTLDDRILELALVDAVGRADMPAVRKVVDKAKAMNADHVDGLTFEARLALFSGKPDQAESMLKQVIARGAAPGPVYRLLSRVQEELGKLIDARESIKQALSITPNDLSSNIQYLQLIDKSGNTNEALAEATRLERLFPNNMDFLKVYLDLLGKSGRRTEALAKREIIYQRDPANTENAVALAEMYMVDRDWARSRAVLDKLGDPISSSALAAMNARWQAEQGQVDKGAAVLQQYIDSVVAKGQHTSTPFLAYARFLIQYKRVDAGLEAYKKAREYQDPTVLEADVERADTLFRMRRFTDAIAVYREILAPNSKFGRPSDVRLRLIETAILARDYKLAEQEFNALGSEGTNSLTGLLLKARLMREQGDINGARSALDDACAKYASDPLPFQSRGELLANNPAFLRDAIADFDTAIKLRPGYATALTRRGLAKLALKDESGGLQDLRAAADADPSQADLRIALINELLNRGRDAEAGETAEAGIRARQSDLQLAIRMGDLFAARKFWPRAQGIYAQLWERTKAPGAAERYAYSLLRSDPPKLATAEQLLTTPQAKTTENWGLMLLRSELRFKQRNVQAAQGDALASFNLAAKDHDNIHRFYDSFIGSYPVPADAISILKGFKATPAGTDLWISLYMARLQALAASGANPDPAAMRSVIDALDHVGTSAMNANPPQPAVAYMSRKVLSEANMAIGRDAEAAQAAQQALQLVPDDAMLNNNLAYLMATKLSKPDEALPYAVKAAESMPERADIQDTLGTVYLTLKQFDKAVPALTKSLTLPSTPADKAFTGTNLVRALVALNQKPMAKEVLNQVRQWRQSDQAAKERVSDVQISELERECER